MAVSDYAWKQLEVKMLQNSDTKQNWISYYSSWHRWGKQKGDSSLFEVGTRAGLFAFRLIGLVRIKCQKHQTTGRRARRGWKYSRAGWKVWSVPESIAAGDTSSIFRVERLSGMMPNPPSDRASELPAAATHLASRTRRRDERHSSWAWEATWFFFKEMGGHLMDWAR
jgi:hypothetical protein